ncbi:tyrosine-type recombinase/integrase [Actinoplanes sp. NPDC051861]|uniref:tyrosine-type recombinase/integrase n=1 Tax=Actinoplanes sp. NPDC051861 TaxID=3155170 RepID=UPI003421B8C6
MPRQHPRTTRPSLYELGPYRPWIDSWQLSLQAARRSEKTVTGYVEDLRLFVGWLLRHRPAYRDWEDVCKADIRHYFVWLQAKGVPCPHQLLAGDPAPAACEGYAIGYVRHAAVGVQQFYAWWAAEEDAMSPVDGVELPAQQGVGKSLVPVHDDAEFELLIKDAEKGRDFKSRRDAAMIRLFAASGIRREEMHGLNLGDLNIARREAVVRGKGGKERRIRYDSKTAIALDRYLRVRAKVKNVPMGDAAPLWIGRVRSHGWRMTTSGITGAVTKRAKALGIETWLHKWRHTFSHNYLDRGGEGGDLMELNGWDSHQMLAHYGRSARNARAVRAYDRVMGDF